MIPMSMSRLTGGMMRSSATRLRFTALHVPLMPASIRTLSSTPAAFHQSNHVNQRINGLKAASLRRVGITDHSAPLPSAPTAPPFELRPHQEDMIHSIYGALGQGQTRFALSGPKGSGKTTAVMQFLDYIAGGNPDHGGAGRNRALIITSDAGMLEQVEGMARTLLGSRLNVELSHGVDWASDAADIVITTWRTLNRRLATYDPSEFAAVVVCEGHEAVTPTLRKILHHFNAEVDVSPDSKRLTEDTPKAHEHRVPIIGISACLTRPDQIALNEVYEEIIHHTTAESLRDQDLFVPISSKAVLCDLGLKHVHVDKSGDYDESRLQEVMQTEGAVEVVVDSYLELASDRRSTHIVCVHNTHVYQIVSMLAQRAEDIEVEGLTADTLKGSREAIIERFRDGETQVLVTSRMLLDREDLAFVDCVINASPSKGNNLTQKILGSAHGVSPETGKEDLLFIDIVDTGVPQPLSLPVLPTLVGRSHNDPRPSHSYYEHQFAPRDEAFDPAAPLDVEYRNEGDRRELEQETFLNLADPFRLLDDKGRVDISMSRNAWVYCGNGRYFLDLLGEGYITITSDRKRNEADGSWPELSFTYLERDPGEDIAEDARFFTGEYTRITTHARTVPLALEAGDRLAAETMGYMETLKLQRHAAWRAQPCSDDTMVMLLQMWHPDHLLTRPEVGEENISAGRAAACISAITQKPFAGAII